MNKKTSIILISFLILSCFLPIITLPNVEAAPVLVAYDFNDTAETYLAQHVHPSDDESLTSCTWQEFQPASNGYLATITVRANKINSPNAYYTAMLQSINGSDYPTGTVLAQSTTFFQASMIPANPTSTDLTFEFDETYQILSSTKYAFVIYAYNATALDGNNYLMYRYSNVVTGVNTLGTILYRGNYVNNGWTRGSAGYAMFFTITASASPPPTATPSPEPTAAPTGHGNWIDNEYSNDTSTGYAWLEDTLPFFVPLILIAATAILGWCFAGVWGFFAGFNIGAILCYVIFPLMFPLWAIVAVIIVDALLLFGKVGMHWGG